MRKKTLQKIYCVVCLTVALCASVIAQGPSSGNPGKPSGPNPASGGPSVIGKTPGRTPSRPHNSLQFGPVGRWWDDKSVVEKIGLRRDQQKKMDVIFDANKQAIIDSYKTFLKAEANLSAANKDTQADKARVFAAIDTVNQARSALQKATSAMLLQIREQMDLDQISRLEKVQ